MSTFDIQSAFSGDSTWVHLAPALGEPMPDIPCQWRVEVVDRFPLPGDVLTAWQEFANEYPSHSPEWMEAWWTQLGQAQGRLVIAVVRGDERVLGIAPFYLVTTLKGRSLKMLGSGETCTDYLDIFSDPAHASNVGRTLFDWLTSKAFEKTFGRIDYIEIEGHLPDASGVQALSQAAITSAWRVEPHPLSSCWAIRLPRTQEEFLGKLSKRMRARFRKALRMVEENAVVYQVHETPEQIDSVWSDFVHCHQSRRVQKGDKGCFAEAGFGRFLHQSIRELAKSGKARLVSLMHEDSPIAMAAILTDGQAQYVYQTGAKSEAIRLEPGHLLNALNINAAIQQGVLTFDFMRGDEPYKARWNAQPVELMRTRLWASHWHANLTSQLLQFGRIIKSWQRSSPMSDSEE